MTQGQLIIQTVLWTAAEVNRVSIDVDIFSELTMDSQMKTVTFTRMRDGTTAEYAFLEENEVIVFL